MHHYLQTNYEHSSIPVGLINSMNNDEQNRTRDRRNLPQIKCNISLLFEKVTIHFEKWI